MQFPKAPAAALLLALAGALATTTPAAAQDFEQAMQRLTERVAEAFSIRNLGRLSDADLYIRPPFDDASRVVCPPLSRRLARAIRSELPRAFNAKNLSRARLVQDPGMGEGRFMLNVTWRALFDDASLEIAVELGDLNGEQVATMGGHAMTIPMTELRETERQCLAELDVINRVATADTTLFVHRSADVFSTEIAMIKAGEKYRLLGRMPYTDGDWAVVKLLDGAPDDPFAETVGFASVPPTKFEREAEAARLAAEEARRREAEEAAARKAADEAAAEAAREAAEAARARAEEARRKAEEEAARQHELVQKELARLKAERERLEREAERLAAERRKKEEEEAARRAEAERLEREAERRRAEAEAAAARKLEAAQAEARRKQEEEERRRLAQGKDGGEIGGGGQDGGGHAGELGDFVSKDGGGAVEEYSAGYGEDDGGEFSDLHGKPKSGQGGGRFGEEDEIELGKGGGGGAGQSGQGGGTQLAMRQPAENLVGAWQCTGREAEETGTELQLAFRLEFKAGGGYNFGGNAVRRNPFDNSQMGSFMFGEYGLFQVKGWQVDMQPLGGLPQVSRFPYSVTITRSSQDSITAVNPDTGGEMTCERSN
ncbi:hypothetical protein LNKW23_06560 [Paralimibaculum aggregatum]|uniref:Uncharacterized protein n=1 Tax=Paralimibaculum aggregatum TaxID=3036245 RepID=A0ABQ6LKX1_9RHOB|nr:hypothetical protein [Limibaculum sp. NKW23]GMG81443.1 hypothetical protein LNKW23_06560 [Limibaculum sp. NKW23]